MRTHDSTIATGRYIQRPFTPGEPTRSSRSPTTSRPNPQTVLQLAQATGALLMERHDGSTPCPAVFVGTGAHDSADMVQGALQAGFNAAGVDVVLGGPLPTPAVAYITRLRHFQMGVAVAGNGLPFSEHGLRLFDAQGEVLSKADESTLAQRMRETPISPTVPLLGSTWPLPSAAELYTEMCHQRVGRNLNLHGMSLVLDTAHSAAYAMAAALLERLGARVSASQTLTGDSACATDSTGDRLSQAVRTLHADLGIALSADGQSVRLADATGRLYGGDELLYLLACDARQRGVLMGGVVGTTTSNLGLELALARQGLAFARAPSGERAMLQTLRQRGWTLGASPNGQLIHLGLHPGSDGLLAALQVLGVMRRSRQELSTLCSDLQLYAQCQMNLAVPADSDWQHNSRLQGCRERAEHGLAGQGRVLLHACEHEPQLRVMVECPDARRAAALAMELANTMGHAVRTRSAEPIKV